jgi:hypothetical protein
MASDAAGYEKGRTYGVVIEAHGPLIDVRIDGQQIFSVVDATFGHGTIALYSCENAGSTFDDIVVEGLVGVNIPPVISSAAAVVPMISDRQTTQVRVLARDFVETDRLGEGQAIEVARLLLRENPKRIFGV